MTPERLSPDPSSRSARASAVPDAPADADAAAYSPGLRWYGVLLLALLAVPRVITHDLALVPPGSPLNALLAVLPPVLWVLVVLLRRAPRPLLSLLAVGAVYGFLLALGHQLLWEQAFDGGTPQLGGRLQDLPPAANALLTRGAAVISSLFTGVALGLVTGAVAAGLQNLGRVMRRE